MSPTESEKAMLFLIEYDRSNGTIVTFRVFSDMERSAANDSRLELELNLHRRAIEHEVVLLEAATEAAVRRTHRRYFEDLAKLARTPLE